MGKIKSFRDLMGVIKDQASLSKAAIVDSLSSPQTISLHLSVLRATTHIPSAPPEDHQLSALLSLGDGSRATASYLISSIMDRLHRTSNSTVALKCLLIIHYIVKQGSFILQDQLSIFPATGGHNYLKLSNFRDGATASTWVLSIWVRWYARYMETLLSTSRILGFFLCSSSNSLEKENQEEKISSVLNKDLIRAVDSLIGLVEEICRTPDPRFVEGNKLLYEVISLLSKDYLSIVNEILPRLGEVTQRLSCLSFSDSVELTCGLKRLEDCKEKLSVLFTVEKPSMKDLWVLITELKEKLDKMKDEKEERKLLMWKKSGRVSESARFDGRVLRADDSVLFSSRRLSFRVNNYDDLVQCREGLLVRFE